MELANERQFVLKRAVAIAVLFIGAAAARISWISQMRGLWGDEPFYTWLGSGLLNGYSLSPSSLHLSPLLPTLIGLVARTLGAVGMGPELSLELGTLFVYVLCGGLLVAPVYGIARRMGNEAIAAGAGLATMFYPVMLGGFPQASVMAEPIYLLMIATAWYFLLLAVDGALLWPTVLGGLFVGLAYLARTEALVYMVAALGLLLVATWLSRKDHFVFRRAAAHAVVAFAMFVLIAGPYLAAFYQVRL